jgi:predicted DNA-binding transcriptional regulator AlpA
MSTTDVKPFPKSGAVSVLDVAAYLDICPLGVRRLAEKDPTFPKPKRVLRSLKWDAKAVIQWFEGDNQ